MIRFNDATNIVITGTIISYTPKPKGQSGPPDSVEMQVDGYEPEVTRLLGQLRWTWTGWALIKDIWRVRKSDADHSVERASLSRQPHENAAGI
jgi:hypothetical protein